MEDYRILYRILKQLSRAMSCDEICPDIISAEALGVDGNRWARLMKTLVKKGYIEGVAVIEHDLSVCPVIRVINPSITLDGITFLEENSLMKQAADIAKTVIPLMKP